MNARDSDEDLRDFMPDVAAIRREADPAYAEKKLKEALNNPELDRALAEVRALKEKEATMTASSIKAPATPSGAAPSHRAAMGAPPRRPRRLSAWGVYALAVLAALVPAVLVYMLVKPPAAQVAPPEVSGPASDNAAAPSAAPSPAVNPPEGAPADAGASDASTASAAVEPTLSPLTPPSPTPTGAPLNKGSAPPRAGSAAPWPKGPASGRPKPPASASPKTTPLKENEYLP